MMASSDFMSSYTCMCRTLTLCGVVWMPDDRTFERAAWESPSSLNACDDNRTSTALQELLASELRHLHGNRLVVKHALVDDGRASAAKDGRIAFLERQVLRGQVHCIPVPQEASGPSVRARHAHVISETVGVQRENGVSSVLFALKPLCLVLPPSSTLQHTLDLN